MAWRRGRSVASFSEILSFESASVQLAFGNINLDIRLAQECLLIGLAEVTNQPSQLLHDFAKRFSLHRNVEGSGQVGGKLKDIRHRFLIPAGLSSRAINKEHADRGEVIGSAERFDKVDEEAVIDV